MTSLQAGPATLASEPDQRLSLGSQERPCQCPIQRPIKQEKICYLTHISETIKSRLSGAAAEPGTV
jgi:hypothetical protein